MNVVLSLSKKDKGRAPDVCVGRVFYCNRVLPDMTSMTTCDVAATFSKGDDVYDFFVF